jgi:tetratricopeptide (TPR) repeat protein
LAAADRAWREVKRAAGVKPDQVVDAAVDFVVAARLAGRYLEALHVGADAAALVGRTAGGRVALVEAHVCMSCLDAGELSEAERFFASAQGRAVDPRDRETLAALCRAEGNLRLAQRLWIQAVDAFRRGHDHTTDPLERTIALYNMGEAHIRLRHFEAAVKLFREALAEKERLGDRWGLSYTWWGIAVCELEGGLPEAALDSVENGLKQVQTLADPKITARLTVLRARCLGALGRFDEAEQRARDAVRESTRAALPRERADAQLALAEVLLQRGFGRRAEVTAMQALDIARKGAVLELEEAAEAVLERARHARSGEGSALDDPTGPVGQIASARPITREE